MFLYLSGTVVEIKASLFEKRIILCMISHINQQYPLTLQYHPLFHALLEPAILTSIPLRLCNLTVTIRNTSIHSFILYRPFEETFTPFTSDDPIVQPCSLIFADHTDHGLVLLFSTLPHIAGRRGFVHPGVHGRHAEQWRKWRRRHEVQSLHLLVGG